MRLVFIICIMATVIAVVLNSKRDSDRDDEGDGMMFM